MNRRLPNDKGFTLVELLVVIIIIGVLTSVALPMFLNQQKRAQDAAAEADLSKIAKELTTFFVDTTDPPVLTHDVAGRAYLLDGDKIGIASENVMLGSTATILGPQNWCVYVTNAKGAKAVTGLSYSAQTGRNDGPC